MTETGYLLTEEEIQSGYILACQSTPKTDIKVTIDLSANLGSYKARGQITNKTMLTHDICQLGILLETPLPYQAGQFAELEFATLPGVKRSYSFATAPTTDNKVSFIIRHIPEGKISSRAVDEDVVGETVNLHGPGGNFHLRPGQAPVLMVAGGSGLAPILAMLDQAQQRKEQLPITLLFGAREQKDLYALDKFAELASSWPNFHFIPVLSAEAVTSSWRGKRGLVTDFIAQCKGDANSAYLCGPPAMVDAAADRLKTLGFPQGSVFADRFSPRPANSGTTLSGFSTKAIRMPARLTDYLKFVLFHVIALGAASVFMLGGRAIPIGLAAILGFYVIGDAICGNDTSVPRFKYTGLLTAQLWMVLPLLSLVMFTSIWSICTGDPLGFGAFITHLTGYNVLAARCALFSAGCRVGKSPARNCELHGTLRHCPDS